MDSLFYLADGYLIQLYRITGNPLVDYFIGTSLLALVSVLVGETTVLLLKKVNGFHLERLDSELKYKFELSVESKRSGDEAGYRQLNKEANDAFGRVFFNMFTFSAASLWSVFVVLAWMQTRFMQIEFPLPLSMPVFGESVGYAFIFLLLYVLTRIFIGNLKKTIALNIKHIRTITEST